ncbi:MAG: hypothetical protein CV090_14120 [Nitrospira sp. WS238]|nr:hypothetical protein [Nitrospira sp. WS238]
MAGMSKNEKQAWEILLGDIRHARRTYRHLMERAQSESEKVRLYLSTLDEEEILRDGLLGKLRQVVSGQDANRHRHPLST